MTNTKNLVAELLATSLTGKDVPRVLRNFRKDHGITQHALAAELGVHWMTVSKWERGVAAPSRFYLKIISMLEILP